MVEAAWKPPPLRASMFPVGLKRACVANPSNVVAAPCESPTKLLMGEADGVASNAAVKVPVCVESRGLSWKPLPAVALTQGEVTTRVTEAECETPPLVPTIVRWKVPIGVEVAVEMVSVEVPEAVMLAGLKLEPAFAGRPWTESATVPEKPLMAPTVTV